MTEDSNVSSDKRVGAHDMLTVQEVGMIDGLSTQIVKICVWAHSTQRFEQGLMMLRRQNFSCSEMLLRDLARFHRVLWQMDAPRSERPRCFLCTSVLPDQSDELCKCFRECQAGRYLDPITPQTLGELRSSYPDEWQTIVVETVICEQPLCGRLMSITAGVVGSKFAKGKAWKSPKLCMDCFNEKQGHMQRSGQQGHGQGPHQDHGRRHGSPLRAAIKDVNKGSKVELKTLQETVAAEAPEIAES